MRARVALQFGRVVMLGPPNRGSNVARVLAKRLNRVYCDSPLPRGAAGIDWYESQMGPSFLIHGLVRIALMDRDGLPCVLDADYTAR